MPEELRAVQRQRRMREVSQVNRHNTAGSLCGPVRRQIYSFERHLRGLVEKKNNYKKLREIKPPCQLIDRSNLKAFG